MGCGGGGIIKISFDVVNDRPLSGLISHWKRMPLLYMIAIATMSFFNINGYISFLLICGYAKTNLKIQLIGGNK